jgi:uncharacterized membrane protein
MMHSLLESYLSEVAAQLSALPAKQRNEELREMRAHLENAVFVSRELGQSEEEAAQNVVAQFGGPKDLGENVVWAWRREQTLSKHSFWGATLCTFALLFLAGFSEGPFVKAYFNLVVTASPLTAQYIFLAFELFGPLVAGIITGSFFSKKAVAGNASGVVAYSSLCLCFYTHRIFQPGYLQHFEPFSPATVALRFLAPLVTEGLVALTAAWISSRLRLTWRERRRLVQV